MYYCSIRHLNYKPNAVHKHWRKTNNDFKVSVFVANWKHWFVVFKDKDFFREVGISYLSLIQANKVSRQDRTSKARVRSQLMW